MTVIKKGIIRSYDAPAHAAAVQIAGSLAVWLDSVRVATNIPAADVVAGRRCSVLFLDPSNQDDAAVIAIHEGLPSGGGGGGATDQIKDADNDTKVQVEEGVDEDKVRMDVAGTERIVLQDATPHLTLTGDLRITSGDLQLPTTGKLRALTTDRITFASSSPHMTHDGNVRFNDEIAVKSAPATNVMLAIKPTFAITTTWTGIEVSPDLTDTTSANNLAPIGLAGIVSMNPDGATSGHKLYGLQFQARVSTGGMADGETISIADLVGAELLPAVYNYAFAVTTTVNVTKATGLWVRPWFNYGGAFGGAGLGTVTTFRAVYVDASSSSADSDHIQDWYGIVIDDPSNPTGNIRLIEAGPSTPYLRLRGGGAPGANQTNLWLNENGTLRQVKWKDGASIGAGDKVMVLV